jgi:hypothetical protein|tara:strand:+ start:1605 stop:1811 length:207 start_codon:yes stop_codon:yes gene_type:complete
MARYEKTSTESQAIQDWLDKGNKITQCETGAFTEGVNPGYGWGRKPKAGKPVVQTGNTSVKKKPAKKK